jgi:hypothetical protein
MQPTRAHNLVPLCSALSPLSLNPARSNSRACDAAVLGNCPADHSGGRESHTAAGKRLQSGVSLNMLKLENEDSACAV